MTVAELEAKTEPGLHLILDVEFYGAVSGNSYKLHVWGADVWLFRKWENEWVSVRAATEQDIQNIIRAQQRSQGKVAI